MAGDFYETIPVLDNFADAVRAENYRPLPDDWAVGFADVVGSTQAVANGRYKAVNMVGAGVIAAVGNATHRGGGLGELGRVPPGSGAGDMLRPLRHRAGSCPFR